MNKNTVITYDFDKDLNKVCTEYQALNDLETKRNYPGNRLDCVHIHKGKRWTRIDIGGSGAFMLDTTTGFVHGIKGYGKPHPNVIVGHISKITGKDLLRYRWARAHTPPVHSLTLAGGK